MSRPQAAASTHRFLQRAHSYDMPRQLARTLWRIRWLLAFVLLGSALDGTHWANAQLPQPKLDWIFPPGGQRAAQTTVTISGVDLDDAREIVFSHPSLSARPTRSPADEFFPDGKPIAQQFALEIGADVHPGVYDAQIVGRHGLSTIRAIHVSDLTEGVDNGANHSREHAQLLALGTVVSGRTDADSADYYALELAAGESATCEIWAQRIDSQAEIWIEILSDDDQPIKAKRRWDRSDPVLDYTATSARKIFLRVADVTFRGGEPFFYRLAVHSRPVVDYVLPPAAQLNVDTDFTIIGKRLGEAESVSSSSATQLRRVRAAISLPPSTDDSLLASFPLVAQPREIETQRFVLSAPDLALATEQLYVGAANGPVVSENSSNDLPEQAQPIDFPSELGGTFYPAGDVDWIELRLQETSDAVIEVFAQRLGLPADPQVIVSRVTRDAEGGEKLEQAAIAEGSDPRPSVPGYNLATDDPYVRLTLEKDVLYRVMVRDLDSSSYADPNSVYRLVVRRPKPDFQLLTAPISPIKAVPPAPQLSLRWPLTLRAGGALAIPLIALRRDGFSGEIAVTAENLPAGVHCKPSAIRAGKSEGLVVLTADAQAASSVSAVRIVGTGVFEETSLKNVAFPASLVWDSTRPNYDRTRLNRQLSIAVVAETAPVALACETSPVEVVQGSAATAKLAVALRAELKEPLSVEPVGLPAGASAKFTLAEDRQSAVLEISAGDQVEPGHYDFVLRGEPKILYQNNPEAAQQANADVARISMILEALKAQRASPPVETTVAQTDAKSAPADADPETLRKQLDERIARGEATLKEATERATKLTAAAQPAERLCEVVSNVITLHVTAKAKQ